MTLNSPLSLSSNSRLGEKTGTCYTAVMRLITNCRLTPKHSGHTNLLKKLVIGVSPTRCVSSNISFDMMTSLTLRIEAPPSQPEFHMFSASRRTPS